MAVSFAARVKPKKPKKPKIPGAPDPNLWAQNIPQAIPAPPPRAPTPPPPSLQGQNYRITSKEDYGRTMGDINRALMQAAMRYGGVNKVQQFGFTPEGQDTSSSLNVASDPNSMMAQIGRWLTEAKTVEGNNQNARNTFFSGLHQAARRKLAQEASREQSAARSDYQNSIADLISQLQGARSSRDEVIRQANLADLQATAANEPEPGPVLQPNGMQMLANVSAGSSKPLRVTAKGTFKWNDLLRRWERIH